MIYRERLSHLISYFDIKYQNFRADHNYSFFEQTSTFSNESVAKTLLSIKDQSYDYVFEYLKNHKYSNLYNAFSGSGRLIRELNSNGMIECFQNIYNIDNSINMINFEKKIFSNYHNVNCICENFLSQKAFIDYNSLLICHSGLRYVENNFVELVNKLLTFSSYNNDCIISETSISIINLFITELGRQKAHYSCYEKEVTVHRNTRLYYAFLLFNDDFHFKKDILYLSKTYNIGIPDIMIDISGFKKVKQFLIHISNVR